MENIAVVLLALELRVVFPFGKNSRVATTKKKKNKYSQCHRIRNVTTATFSSAQNRSEYQYQILILSKTAPPKAKLSGWWCFLFFLEKFVAPARRCSITILDLTHLVNIFNNNSKNLKQIVAVLAIIVMTGKSYMYMYAFKKQFNISITVQCKYVCIFTT